MSIALYEDFDHPAGVFANYDTYDVDQRDALAAQRHVDIRSFVQDPVLGPYNMINLDVFRMNDLNGRSMLSLETGLVVREGEAWSTGTVGPQPSRNNFLGLTLSCAIGANVTTSVMLTRPIDLTPLPIESAFISLALPSLPLSSIDPTRSFIQFTADPNGSFAVPNCPSLQFADATTLTNGDCEASWPLAILTVFDLSAITGVRFQIYATGACTFRCLAVRALDPSWVYAPLDQNTLYERVGATVPPTGATAGGWAFPTAASPVSPSDWPVLLFSEAESPEPAPVNLEVGAVFHTGSASAQNQVSLYFRELSQTMQSVGGLNGASMRNLVTNTTHLPDYEIGNLDDFRTTRYLTVTVAWGSQTAVRVRDDKGNGYTFTALTLDAATDYYVYVVLADNSLRVQIYALSSTGLIDWSTQLFDSTAIIDSIFVSRRKGRFGWYANFGDGDAYLTNVRPRRTVYGEYRSLPLHARTPVEGARLYPDSTPAIDLFRMAGGTAGAVVNSDTTKSRSGNCLRVQCDGALPLQGLQSAPIRFENFYDTTLEFDVLAPFSARLAALLVGEGRYLLLYLPNFPTNRWTHMRVPMEPLGFQYQPGSYSLLILQAEVGTNTWYVDNLAVRTSSVSWAGRSQAPDAWGIGASDWVKADAVLNDPNHGICLGRGRDLQIRGEVVRQEGELQSVKILPKYAELGDFLWPEDAPPYPLPPVPTFDSSVDGRRANFRQTGAAAHLPVFDITAPLTMQDLDALTLGDLNQLMQAQIEDHSILAYCWTFGDGTFAYGANVSHTYVLPGAYTVTLTMVDLLGQKIAFSGLAQVA